MTHPPQPGRISQTGTLQFQREGLDQKELDRQKD